MKRSYKDYAKRHIGGSDISALIVVGMINGNADCRMLKFGGDGEYSAYICRHAETDELMIGEHYRLMHTFTDWIAIYDDCGRTMNIYGDVIRIYRASDYGCVIEICEEVYPQ